MVIFGRKELILIYKHSKPLLIIVLLCSCLTIVCCNSNTVSNDETLSSKQVEESKDNTSTKNTEEDNIPKECSIMFAGDVLMHGPELEAAYNSSTNSYNFDDFFSNVKDYISSSDLSICDSETSYLGEGSPYTGYPCFNSPTSVLDSLKNAGFDILASAHNHILDSGSEGVSNTAKSITSSGFDLIGLKNNEADKNYIVKDINGIKLGITNFTYATSNNDGSYNINGIPLPKKLENIINFFDDQNPDLAINKMKDTINNMKNDGAEFLIFYIHWGEEYQTLPDNFQQSLAKNLNNEGVDVIIGSHPHVVESVRHIKNDNTGKETLVCYSLGNFVSNQRGDNIGHVQSEDGLMVKLHLYKDALKNVILKSYETKATWVNKYTDSNGKLHFNILPAQDIANSNNPTNYSQEVLSKIKNSYNSTENIINS